MVSDVFALASQSFAVVFFVVVFFWGVVGVAVAARRGWKKWHGAAISGLLPGIGALMMLVMRHPSMGATRRHGLLAGPPATGGGAVQGWGTAAPAAPVVSAWGDSGVQSSQAGSGWGASAGGMTYSGVSSSASTGWGQGGFAPSSPSEPMLAVSKAFAANPGPTPPAIRATPFVAAGTLVLALFFPFVSLQLPRVGSDDFYIGSSFLTLLPLLVTLGLVVMTGLLHARTGGVVWPLLGCWVGTWLVLLAAQAFFVTRALGDVLSHLTHRIPNGTGAGSGLGAGALFLSGLLLASWSAYVVWTEPAR